MKGTNCHIFTTAYKIFSINKKSAVYLFPPAYFFETAIIYMTTGLTISLRWFFLVVLKSR